MLGFPLTSTGQTIGDLSYDCIQHNLDVRVSLQLDKTLWDVGCPQVIEFFIPTLD
jgi:hypothetical protein